MPRVSPTLEGFRAALKRPSLTFAEISWRWTVGAIAWCLILFGLIEFLETLRVSKGDAALLATRQPLLVGRALQHILNGSMSRASIAALSAAIALSILWICFASIGRAATVRGLLEYFRDKFATTSLPSEAPALRSLIGLNFLRVATALAALLAFAGAAVLVSFASTDKNPHPGLVFVLFLPLAALICVAWLTLNWLLSLAGLFAVCDGEHTVGAISAAVTFFRAHLGAVCAVSTWVGLAHLTALSIASTVVSMPLAFLQIVPSRIVLAVVLLISLGYFALADWLYVGRLAGYICIAEMPEALAAPAPLPAPPAAPPQTAIDRNELILSDIPGLATQT